MAGTSVTTTLKIMRSLPEALCGMGITRKAGPVTEKGAIDSRARSLTFVREHWPFLLPVTERWPVEDIGLIDPDAYDGGADQQLPAEFMETLGIHKPLVKMV